MTKFLATRRTFALATSVVLAATMLPFDGAWAQSAKPQSGGTLLAVIQPEPTILTSAFTTNNPSLVVSTNIFDGLLAYDAQQRPQPSLAERWEVSSDFKTFTFHLRRGVKWHDGREFSSADVAFSALEVWKKLHGRGRQSFAALMQVDTPDASTAVLRFSQPAPAVLAALSSAEAQILPRHLYEGTDIQKNPHNSSPIGTGAFRFKQWKRGEYIALQKNPDYWDRGRPYLDSVIYRIIPDMSARTIAFETGDVQYGVNTPVPLADLERLRKNRELAVDSRGYGWASNYLLTEFNLRNPILAKLPVRQAIAHAIDKQALIKSAWYGYGKPADSPIATSLPGFHADDVQKYALDLEQANRLLDQAGYPRGANGTRFSLQLAYLPFGDVYRNSAEFVRQSLKRIGIDVVITNRDLATYVKAVYSDYAFDLNVLQQAAFTDPQIGIHRTFWSKAAAKGTPYVNASGYSSPEMDAAIEASRAESDPAKRRQQFVALQKIAARDLPVIPLVEIEQFTVYNRKVHGVNLNFDGQLTTLKEVWIEH